MKYWMTSQCNRWAKLDGNRLNLLDILSECLQCQLFLVRICGAEIAHFSMTFAKFGSFQRDYPPIHKVSFAKYVKIHLDVDNEPYLSQQRCLDHFLT